MLVYYLTDTLGVAAIVAGLVVTVAKIWDVIIDPVIGARSRPAARAQRLPPGHDDRSARSPSRCSSSSPSPCPPGPSQPAAAVWVLIAFLLTATAFSLFQVPYIALPAELASGYDQRTRLLTWRVVVLTFAILLFGAGGPALRSLGGDDKFAGYLLMALVAGVVIGAGMLVSSFVAPRNPVADAPAPPRESIADAPCAPTTRRASGCCATASRSARCC